MIGNAGLFYNQNTGIKYFNREIASLRLTLHPEGINIQYIQEAYIFNDNFSLYRDNMVSSERGIYSQFTLKDINQNGRSFINDKGSIIQSIPGTDIDMSQLSSLLLVAQKIIENDKSDKMYQFISHNGNHSAMRILYITKKQEKIAGKNIPVDVISLTFNNREIHRYKFYKDNSGYVYPVAVYFNIDDTQNAMELLLEEFPGPQSIQQTQSQTSVVYLDFMEAKSQSLKDQTPIDKLVRESVYNQIKKELNAAVIGSGKQLVLDMKSGMQMNTAPQIKQIIAVTFEQDVPGTEKIKKIIDRLQVPPQVDIIVTGQYVDDPVSTNIMIRPIIILKTTIESKNLMFERAQLFCRESSEPGTGSQVPCQNSENYIAKEIQQFLMPALKFNRETPEFTIEEIYRTIMENRYFCHAPDYGYHYEILERLRQSERIDEQDSVQVSLWGSGEASLYNYTFKSNWEVKTVLEPNKRIVKTISANKNDYSKIISLYWDLVEGSETTYDKALQMIDLLNAINNEEHADWRLPTLEELLNITSNQSGLPFSLPFSLPLKKINTIWSSTPLEKNEKRLLTSSETDTYFVLKRVRDKQGEKVQFDILEKNQTAFFLPVRSPISAGRQSSKNGQKGLSIANLAFLNNSDHSPMVFGELGQALDKVVTNGINIVVAFNNSFNISDNNQTFSNGSNANLLANIFFNPNLAKDKKVKQIIDTLMKPYKIDLLVTGIYIDEGNGMIGVRPIVIYKYNQAIKTENLQFRRSEFECWDNGNSKKIICPQAAAQIANAVKALLERS